MKALRFAMMVWGGLSGLMGLFTALFPGPLEALGPGDVSNTFLLGSWGILTAVLGLGVLLASRDPARHILWLNMALVYFAAAAAYDLLNYLTGAVTLGVIAIDLIVFSIFGLLFIALYPRAPRMTPLRMYTPEGALYTDVDNGGLFTRQGKKYIAYFLPVVTPSPSAPLEEPEISEELEETPQPFLSEEHEPLTVGEPQELNGIEPHIDMTPVTEEADSPPAADETETRKADQP